MPIASRCLVTILSALDDLTVKGGKNNDDIDASGMIVGGERKIDGGGSDTIID
jgi:hypothetical protein